MPDLTFLKDLVSNTYFRIFIVALGLILFFSLFFNACEAPDVTSLYSNEESSEDIVPAVNSTSINEEIVAPQTEDVQTENEEVTATNI